MKEYTKIYVNSPPDVASFIERMSQIKDFTYKIGDSQNGAENDEIMCSPDLARLLEDMLSP